MIQLLLKETKMRVKNAHSNELGCLPAWQVYKPSQENIEYRSRTPRNVEPDSAEVYFGVLILREQFPARTNVNDNLDTPILSGIIGQLPS